MKPQRAQKIGNDPSIKGNLTADQIVETVVRMRNTLVLLTMDKGADEAMFHTITADVYEVYMTMMQLLALSLAKARNVETIYTYVNDKAPYRMARKLFGDSNVDFEESDLEQKGKYKLTIDIGDYYRAGQKTAVAQSRG